MRVYVDTETCGLHGPVVLLQYAFGDRSIQLHEVWKEPVGDTLELLTELCQHDVIGFNLAFDWFHINQLYNCLSLLDKSNPPDIKQYAAIESEARNGLCLKPHGCLDLMLHAYKGPYQSVMERDDIIIKRVPTCIAGDVVEYLNQTIHFKDLYFARRAKQERFHIVDIKTDDGIDQDFKNIVLSFSASAALKVLARDALGYDQIITHDDIELVTPDEYGYAPFNQALHKQDIGWPNHIWRNIDYWATDPRARQYAEDDIKYTRGLDRYFSLLETGHSETDAKALARDVDYKINEYIPVNDDDSVLACMVGAIRWRGYEILPAALAKLRQGAIERKNKIKYNFNSGSVCKKYLSQVMTPHEQLSLVVDGKFTTNKAALQRVSKWKDSVVCELCNGFGCEKCDEGFVRSDKPHEAAKRAKEILDYRTSGKEIEIYDKLLQAGRFHASLKIIGARSGRMSGGDGLNPQGIKRTPAVRSCFPLAPDGLVLVGGDFSGFEVCLADAAYKDPELRKDLLTRRPCTCNGAGCKECDGVGTQETKIHALFGQYLFPGKTYEDIMASKGAEGDLDLYTRSKNCLFALLYGGEVHTLTTRGNIPEDVANQAYQGWVSKYKVWGAERKRIFDMFCSMRQPNGLGTKVEWHEPADYIETMLGFKRYFTLENMVCKALFAIAEKPPKHWSDYKIKVVRRDREQTVTGAVRSALLACAFNIQASNMRAAGNHVIQGTGAGLTKKLQRRIWDLQPVGVQKFHVMPLNIHDELMTPCLPHLKDDVTKVVTTFVEEHKSIVPLLAIDWSDDLKSWADK